jgi:hypothetical protein
MLFYLCASHKCTQILRAHCTSRLRVVLFGLVPILLLEFSGGGGTILSRAVGMGTLYNFQLV